MSTAALFSPLTLRDITLRNRIVVSPMCEYSSVDGLANDWHLVHLGSRAVGGAGLVFTEATAVTADGRISPQDLGIWSDAHIDPLARVTQFIDAHGGVAGVQLAHAGRKASTRRPWEGTGSVSVADGGWRPIWAPSPIAFAEGWIVPEALDEAGIHEVTAAFAAAARRAYAAGFRVIEIHAAHGYLLHEFLSPLSNKRTDRYGGSFENRTRLLLDTVRAVREVWPERLPLFVRLSATDWVDTGWTIEDSVALARLLGPLGVDLVDCSSGGNTAKYLGPPMAPGYQVSLAERVRRDARVMTGTVGMIVAPEQAEAILREEQADIVFIARELLRDPYWPLHAAHTLKTNVPWPDQYLRAKPTS
ncbi:MAG TPA: NADH:flavin oxidoreductase/NADH oxidase [Gemmatimonadaceae bacterium]|nr:NADH:flavin oxidoreductase/NADH oxidase [Gemmatimonadaceae bacterium]